MYVLTTEWVARWPNGYCAGLRIEPSGFELHGERQGGSETPASRTFHSLFPPLSVGIPVSLFYFYRKELRNNAKFFFFSPGSRHFWESRFPPLLLLPPVPLPPPILSGSRPPVPLHSFGQGTALCA